VAMYMFAVGQKIRNRKFPVPFIQVRRGKFSKSLGSKYLVLIGLSICTDISTSFSYAFFGDSRIQNDLKMSGCHNFVYSVDLLRY